MTKTLLLAGLLACTSVNAWEISTNEQGSFTVTEDSAKNKNTFFQIIFEKSANCHMYARYAIIVGYAGKDEENVPLELRVDRRTVFQVPAYGEGEKYGQSMYFSLSNSDPQLVIDLAHGNTLRIKGYGVSTGKPQYDSFSLKGSYEAISGAAKKCFANKRDAEADYFEGAPEEEVYF